MSGAMSKLPCPVTRIRGNGTLLSAEKTVAEFSIEIAAAIKTICLKLNDLFMMDIFLFAIL